MRQGIPVVFGAQFYSTLTRVRTSYQNKASRAIQIISLYGFCKEEVVYFMNISVFLKHFLRKRNNMHLF